MMMMMMDNIHSMKGRNKKCVQNSGWKDMKEKDTGEMLAYGRTSAQVVSHWLPSAAA
jgi:hypothetical protein